MADGRHRRRNGRVQTILFLLFWSQSSADHRSSLTKAFSRRRLSQLLRGTVPKSRLVDEEQNDTRGSFVPVNVDEQHDAARDVSPNYLSRNRSGPHIYIVHLFTNFTLDRSLLGMEACKRDEAVP